MRTTLIVLIGVLSGAVAPQRLSVSPPAPFVATRDQQGPPTIFTIRSSTNTPVSVRHDGGLCLLTFTESPDVAGLDQQQLDARKDTREWRQHIVGRMRSADYQPGEAFTVTGVRGLDFLGLKKAAPADGTAEKKTGVYLAIIETPKGQTILTCATLHDGFDAALPQFRSIRDSIRPER
jgi:hypothetical protein